MFQCKITDATFFGRRRSLRWREHIDYAEIKPKRKKLNLMECIKKIKQNSSASLKRTQKEERGEEVWSWWMEENCAQDVNWSKLQHKGPVFAPPYKRLPKSVRFFYDKKPLKLSVDAEEAATFYAKMLNSEYCKKTIFNENFFKDFRKIMTSEEREIITDFRKCNFEEMYAYFMAELEKKKNATIEEKRVKRLEKEKLIAEWGFCVIDGHKERIDNFRVESPGLFRGRGKHPKMGSIKRRIQAEDISINCGAESKIPSPPLGHHWKEVLHDNTVTWLASWVDEIQDRAKYVMLNPSSKLRSERDYAKYEMARRLGQSIREIRDIYRREWKSKDMFVRQRAVAMYFIDKLALRAGYEKDEDQADTVGCCSLRVEHIKLHKKWNEKENIVVFDFPGKDSIRYYNEVEVQQSVFKSLELFMKNKSEGDKLFDNLNTLMLNEHLKQLMDGLTAKVFRTYNASVTLQKQLDLLTKKTMNVPEKILAYNRANRAVAILCNHQRAVPKSHERSMMRLQEKMRLVVEKIYGFNSMCRDPKKAAKCGSFKRYNRVKSPYFARLVKQLRKLEIQRADKDENKTIALSTSKLNYLDPRITVAWCKTHSVPIEKIFNKIQRIRFLWAVHMADENYRF